MTQLRNLALCFILFCSCTALPQRSPLPIIKISQGLEAIEIEKDVWLIMHSDGQRRHNALLYQLVNNDFFLVGTPGEDINAGAFLAWFVGQWPKRKLQIIATSSRPQGSGGNALFKRKGLTVYAGAMTTKVLQLENNFNSLPTDSLPDVPKFTLTFGDEPVEIYYLGPSAYLDQLAVYFPRKKILYASDIARTEAFPRNARPPHLVSWKNVLTALQRLSPRLVIPGQGVKTSPTQLEESKEFINKML